MQPRRSWRNIVYTTWDVLWITIDQKISTARSRLSLRLQGCEFGSDFTTTGHCSFKARAEQSIRIGSHVRFLAGWRSNRVGLSGSVLLQTFGEGVIDIGNHSGGSAVVLSARSRISIGQYVSLGGNVKIYDHDFHALEADKRRLGQFEQEPHVRSSPVVIGNDVFVGANAIILKGVTLGERCIVAAGSVVFKGNYPPDCLIAGNPAQIVGGKSRT